MAVTGSRLYFASMLVALSQVLLILLTGCAGAGLPPAPPVAATSTFVYVSANPGGNNSEIHAFSADSSGRLTPVPGSPFAANVESMAVNGKFLFGTDGTNIFSFSIASNGALTQVSSINGLQFTPPGHLAGVFLDRTGSILFSVDEDPTGTPNPYHSFSIDGSTGALTNLGGSLLSSQGSLNFIGNDVYGYTVDFYHAIDTCGSLDGFKRNNDGTLTSVFPLFADPAGVPAGHYFCPGAMAADQANNLAISLYDLYGAPGVLLAVYTADSSGNLTTNSTSSNMPQSATDVSYLKISPSGKFLAASGSSGLQVFHFNGADPITALTGLIPITPPPPANPPPGTIIFVPPVQIFWDNNSHLYAISKSTNELFVFTVTSRSAIQSPGSPYAITNPGTIVVQPQM